MTYSPNIQYQSILKTKKKENVVNALLGRVDSLMMATENFLKHDSFSTKGGFRVVVNGLVVHTEKVCTKLHIRNIKFNEKSKIGGLG